MTRDQLMNHSAPLNATACMCEPIAGDSLSNLLSFASNPGLTTSRHTSQASHLEIQDQGKRERVSGMRASAAGERNGIADPACGVCGGPCMTTQEEKSE
jgi:hypothetical protein